MLNPFSEDEPVDDQFPSGYQLRPIRDVRNVTHGLFNVLSALPKVFNFPLWVRIKNPGYRYAAFCIKVPT